MIESNSTTKGLLPLAENIFNEKLPFLERETYLHQITSELFRHNYLKLTHLLYCLGDEVIQQQIALSELKASDKIASCTGLKRSKLKKMIKEAEGKITQIEKEWRIVEHLRKQEPLKAFLWLDIGEQLDQMEIQPFSATKGRLDAKEILNKVDIVEVLGSYLPLKRRGRLYVALCPFHEERHPSFTIFPQTQTFHCFGCQKGRNAIDFLMEYKHCSFREALQEVAQRTR